MTHWDYYYYYRPAKPREVKDGIKLESKRLGTTWWSQKWLAALESFGWANRLQRGRRYAKQGQVVNLNIESGLVTATVQGTRPTPYAVSIKIQPISDKNWTRVLSQMATEARYAAKLLAGEMPEDIEQVFTAVNVNLFPQTRRDLKTHCTCPDIANPCKHIAAVYYILAEEFDRDPFMIFQFRGRTKSQVLEELRALRARLSLRQDLDRKVRRKKVLSLEERKRMGMESQPEPPSLEKCIDTFWELGDKFGSMTVSVRGPHVPIALLKRLGPPSCWRTSKLEFYPEMERIYNLVTERALNLAFDEQATRKQVKNQASK
jgi:uncharacterized Zn finger protein